MPAKARAKATSSAAADGVPAMARRLSITSTTAKPTHTVSSSNQPLRPGAACGSGRARMPTTAHRPSARPKSFCAPACSPNSTNAASSDSSNDSRWATSVRTMPVWRTAAASTRNRVGSTQASTSNSGQGAPGWRRASSEGRRIQAASSEVAR